MTKQEYRQLYAKVRKRMPYLTRKAMREIFNTYVEAGELASKALRTAELSGAGELTVASKKALVEQLQEGASRLRVILDSETPKTVGILSKRITDIDVQYTIDAIKNTSLKASVIESLGTTINDRLIALTTERVWSDGYTFSHRVWRVGQDYQTQIKRVLNAGLAQGRDPLEISRDLEAYIKEGKQSLAKRWGPDLESGTKAWMRRIRDSVDYRALRLVRTELYSTLQDAGREAGRINPAAYNQYEWIMEANRQHWDCGCPDLAAGSPYEYNNVPTIPHPNCRCRVEAKLRDNKTFQDNLKNWVQGKRVPYIDEWYNEIYKPELK